MAHRFPRRKTGWAQIFGKPRGLAREGSDWKFVMGDSPPLRETPLLVSGEVHIGSSSEKLIPPLGKPHRLPVGRSQLGAWVARK